MTPKTDLHVIRTALGFVDEMASHLRWAKERPWTVQSHVHVENGVVIIDLHDLNAALTKKVLAAVTERAAELDNGGLIFITGRGRHSVGLPVLNQIVLGTLVRYEHQYGWRQRDLGAGRLLLVVDEDRIPKHYQGHTPLWIPLFFLIFAVALVWATPPAISIPLLGLVCWFAWGVWRASQASRSSLTAEE